MTPGTAVGGDMLADLSDVPKHTCPVGLNEWLAVDLGVVRAHKTLVAL